MSELSPMEILNYRRGKCPDCGSKLRLKKILRAKQCEKCRTIFDATGLLQVERIPQREVASHEAPKFLHHRPGGQENRYLGKYPAQVG